MTLCPIGLVAKRYGVSPSTIRRWEKAGLIKAAVRTFGGHRRFELENSSPPSGAGRRHIGYARSLPMTRNGISSARWNARGKAAAKR